MNSLNLLYKVNEIAMSLFYEWMDGSAAWRYATQERGLTKETIVRWGLGFAPDSWNSLLNAWESTLDMAQYATRPIHFCETTNSGVE